MVVLSEDGHVTSLSMIHLKETKSGLEKHRNATNVAINRFTKRRALSRVAVSEKRRLTLYEYTGGRFQYLRDVTLPHTPVQIEWCDDMVCLGFRKEYGFLNVSGKGGRQDVVSLPGLWDKGETSPNLKVLPGDQVLVVGKNNMGLFVNYDGAPVARNPLLWRATPVKVGYCNPYVLTMFRNRVDVHRFDKSSGQLPELVQSVFVQGCRVFVDGGITGADDSVVLLASATRVYWLMPTPFDEQIQVLLRKNPPRVAEAMQLLQDTTSPATLPTALLRFHRQAALAFVRVLDFASAAKHWCESRQRPEEILLLFPEVLPLQTRRQALSSTRDGTNAAPLRDMYQANVRSVTELVTSMMTTRGSGGSTRRPDKKAVDDVVRSAYECIATILKAHRGSSASTDAPSPIVTKPFPRHVLDTALLRVLVRLSRAKDLEDLVLSDNAIDANVGSEELRRHSRFHVLALMKWRGSEREEALVIWQKLGNGTFRELVEKESNGERSKRTHDDDDGAFRDGIESTIRHLATDFVRDRDGADEAHRMILEFSRWVLLRRPRRAMTIFTTPRHVPLPADKVCELLESVDATLSERARRGEIDGDRGPRLTEQYLEWVLGDDDDEEEPKTSEGKRKRDDDDDESTTRALFTRLALAYMSTSPTLDDEERASRDKLRRLLENPRARFECARLLRRIDELSPAVRSTFIDERASVLGRMGRHEDALRVLLRERSMTSAEQYCLREHVGGDDDVEAAMIVLISLLLEETTSTDKTRAFAMRLLSAHASPRSPSWPGLDPIRVLDVLPDSLPLSMLMPYFALTMPSIEHRLRHAQITKHLCKYNTQVLMRSKLLEAQRRKVVIDEHTQCCVSGEPINEKTAFAVFPNGRICLYHHVDGKDLRVDPVTGETFGDDGTGALPEWTAETTLGGDGDVEGDGHGVP